MTNTTWPGLWSYEDATAERLAELERQAAEAVRRAEAAEAEALMLREMLLREPSG